MVRRAGVLRVTYPYPSDPWQTPPPPPQKSNRGLIIGLGIGVLVLLLVVGAAGLVVVNQLGDDPDTDPVAESTTAPPETGPSDEGIPSDESTEDSSGGDNSGNNAVTAKYSADFEIVCQGGSVLNSAEYRGGRSAKAYVFANSLARPQNYNYQVGFTKPSFYGTSSGFTRVGVVGCLTAVDGSEGPGRKCTVEDSKKKRITLDYVSSRFTLTFYAAKTGEKLGEGGTVNAPATRCPFLMQYDPATRKSYALPDEGAVTAAFQKFMR